MKKIDYKKDFKAIYLPKTDPCLIDMPPITYAVLCGQGNPNGPDFALATEALYAFSYAVKMSYKTPNPPPNYYEYTVFPLEGEWDLVEPAKGHLDKNNLKYKLMIRQPDFLTDDLFNYFLNQVKSKKNNPYLDQLILETIEEGPSCQIMHLGSFDTEPESFKRLESFLAQQGLKRKTMVHREIYLSDPRKTEPAKLKTVLRVSI